MVSAFGDESHDELSARVFAVAVVVGEPAKWDALKSQWTQRTGGRIFHAADCESDKGDFAKSSHDDNLTLYADLSTLLANSGLFGFGHSIDLIALKDVFGQDHLLPESHYYLCFYEVVTDCVKHASRCIPQEQVEFTFDQHFEVEYNAKQWYSYLRSSPEWGCQPYLHGKVAFESRNSAVEIQVADLFAREVMKHLDNTIAPQTRPTRFSLMALLKSGRFRFAVSHREYLKGLREWIRKHKAFDYRGLGAPLRK